MVTFAKTLMNACTATADVSLFAKIFWAVTVALAQAVISSIQMEGLAVTWMNVSKQN